MEYDLQVFEDLAYIARNDFVHAMLTFETPKVIIRDRKGGISAPDLPTILCFMSNLPTSLEQLKNNPDQMGISEDGLYTTWRLGELRLRVLSEAETKKVCRGLATLLRALDPQLKLAPLACGNCVPDQ